jgi:hypothetical protein
MKARITTDPQTIPPLIAEISAKSTGHPLTINRLSPLPKLALQEGDYLPAVDGKGFIMVVVGKSGPCPLILIMEQAGIISSVILSATPS